MVNVGGVVVICIVIGHKSGSDGGLWGFELGMFVWGVLLVEMHGSGNIVVGVMKCELLLLLESSIIVGLTGGFCVPGGILSLVVSLLDVGL